MENEKTFDSRLNLKPCYQDNQEPSEVIENLVDCNAKVCYKEY